MVCAANTPNRIGKYSLIRELGEGGLGVAYLAENTENQERVCVKICKGLDPKIELKNFWAENFAAQ